MKTIKTTIIAVSLITGAQAATVIDMTADLPNSDNGAFGNATQNAEAARYTVNDTSTYDPNNPTAAIDNRPGDNRNSDPDKFEQTYSVTTMWHGDKTTGEHTLSYLLGTVEGTPVAFTTTAANPIVALDFYGRDANFDRDNNYTVTLFNGDYSTVVGTAATGQATPDTSTTAYNRTSFNLGDGKTFDRVRITSAAGAGDPLQYFAVAEVRLASLEEVPEPSSAALLGLGGLALILRRRK